MLLLLARLGGPIVNLFSKGAPSYRASKIVGGIVLALLVVALLGLGKCAYDSRLIRNHDAGRNAQIANDTLAADRGADEASAARQEEYRDSVEQIRVAAEEAQATDPEQGRRPVGPVSRSYYDNLPTRTER